LGFEDVLEVTVWKNENLGRVVKVRPDGRLSLPLLGDRQVAGLTPVVVAGKQKNILRKPGDPIIVV
jgi:polysaccharide export outer membrane protein